MITGAETATTDSEAQPSPVPHVIKGACSWGGMVPKIDCAVHNLRLTKGRSYDTGFSCCCKTQYIIACLRALSAEDSAMLGAVQWAASLPVGLQKA